MNGALLHLIFNHIPVIAIPFALLLLLAGALRKSRDLIQAAYVAFVLISLLTIPAFKSGGPAAHLIKDLPGVERSVVRAHSHAADKAFWGSCVLGFLGLLGLYLLKRTGQVPGAVNGVTLILALILSGWFAWVAHLGGEIRHPEIDDDDDRPAAVSPSQTPVNPVNH